jgi:iron(III) transport system substrate-binding protein
MNLQGVMNPLPNKGGESISISSRFVNTNHEKKEGKKMKHRKVITSLLLLGIFVFVGPSISNAADVLHMYTALEANEAKSYIEAFIKDTNINVEWVKLSAGEILTRLRAEAKNPQVSVWYGGPSVEFIAGKKESLLAPYNSPVGAPFLKGNLKDSADYWSGIYFGAIGFGNNTNFFEKNKLAYPTSWQDLLKPELKANISMAYPYTSGTSYTVLATLVQLMGEDKAFDYWKKLEPNIHHYNTSGPAAVTQAGLGEIAIGIAFSHDILGKGTSKGYPVKATFPSEGTGYEIGAMGLVRGGPEPELGKKFIDWALSKRAQDLMKVWFRIPLNPQAEIASGAIKASDVKLINYDYEWAGSNNKRLIEKWRQTIGK